MRAIVIDQYGGPEVLVQRQVPDPTPGEGEVLVRVRAFGLNHADAYFRSGAWGNVPAITGIEAAGTVEVDRTGRFAPGARVVAILGGMGRTRNGSYAELVTVPADNVAAVSAALPWPVLAAVPEAFATAWSAVHLNLELEPGQRLLVRGATSAVGQAVLQLAARHGATVLATTRNPNRADLLGRLGAAHVLIDDGGLAAQLNSYGGPVHALVDLVGNSVLRDSLRCVLPRGRLVQLGFLGGLLPVQNFDPIVDLPTGVQLSFYGSAFVLGTPEYPLSEIPLTTIFDDVAAGLLHGKPAHVFDAASLVHAHQLMEAGTAGGKMVAVWPDAAAA